MKPYKQARRLLKRDGVHGNRYYYYDTELECDIIYHKHISKSKCIDLTAYALQNQD